MLRIRKPERNNSFLRNTKLLNKKCLGNLCTKYKVNVTEQSMVFNILNSAFNVVTTGRYTWFLLERLLKMCV